MYISPYPYDDPNSDYINAVYVDGFRIKDQFIATQFPLESTVPDFWRLIAEEKVQLIVVLNEIDDEDEVNKFHISSFLFHHLLNCVLAEEEEEEFVKFCHCAFHQGNQICYFYYHYLKNTYLGQVSN